MRRYGMVFLLIVVILINLVGCGGYNDTKKDDLSITKENSEATEAIASEEGGKGSDTSDTAATDEASPTTEPTADEATIEGGDSSSSEVPASIVYMTKEISPESLIKMYEALGREAKGKVAVKIHMGEPGGNNYLKPELVKDFVLSVEGTFVDSNTAYGGWRANTEAHMQAAEDHGFTACAPVDILDSEGEISLPVENGKHLKEDVVGSHFENYEFIVVLSHFKGHAMGGFGGAIKNMSIGFASTKGKNLIHTAGAGETNSWLSMPTEQDDFLESMAEAAKAIADDAGENIIYISVMNNLSVDCDCDYSPAKPLMEDIGILASLDPVALDKACVDQIYAAPEDTSNSLRRRIESKNGTHTLDYAEELGLGSQNYELVMIDE